MKKNKKFMIASCLLFASLAVGATAVACAETNPVPSTPSGSTVEPTSKQNFAFAPEIFVDFGEYSKENIPNAVKGTTYKLFSATAEDVYGDTLPVTTRVYLNYLESTKSLATVTDGCVTPVHYGIYTVEYSATDVFGNVGTYTYDFTCEEIETLSLVLGTHETTTLAGVEIEIPQANVSNAFGNEKLTITATHKGGKVVYDLTDKTSFVPMYAGEYDVEYACSDYNLTVKRNYTLSVEKNDNPVFFGEADLPKYFIVGREYTLPSVEAYQFVTGDPVPVTPLISVKKGTEKAQSLNGNSFKADEEGALTFTYDIICGNNKQTKTYTAKAVSVGEAGPTFDIAKYFYTTDALVTANVKFTTIVAETDGASVEFINSLSAKAFSIKLSTDEFTTNFEAVNIYLKDRVDESIALKLTYANPGKSNSSFAVNDGVSQRTSNAESSIQLISYDNATRQVNFNSSVTINCPRSFKGFPSGMVNLSLEFVGVTGRSELSVYTINNQVISQDQGDFFAPEMWFTATDRSTFGLGEVIDIAKVECADVLDFDSKLYISVIAPSRGYAVSEKGVTLQNYTGSTEDCKFTATEYGSYLIRFVAEDSSGNTKMYAYSIIVKELVPPQVKLETKMPKTVKANEAFTVSNVIISDDVSAPENCTVSVNLLGPLGDATFLTAGQTYKLTMKGTYYVCYVVKDEAGNMTMLKHKIVVE